MNILDIIKTLKKEGYKITYRKRTDGGYIIKKIDGQAFKGAKGNIFARSLLGENLSEARAYQLGRINKRSSYQRKMKYEKLPEQLLKELHKVQRAWRKSHPTIKGGASLNNIRYQYKTYGLEKTIQSLDKNWRYAQGYAYVENVDWIIERIKLALGKDDSEEMRNVINRIELKKLDFKEDWIQPIHNAIYKWEDRVIEADECAARILSIIG